MSVAKDLQRYHRYSQQLNAIAVKRCCGADSIRLRRYDGDDYAEYRLCVESAFDVLEWRDGDAPYDAATATEAAASVDELTFTEAFDCFNSKKRITSRLLRDPNTPGLVVRAFNSSKDLDSGVRTISERLRQCRPETLLLAAADDSYPGVFSSSAAYYKIVKHAEKHVLCVALPARRGECFIPAETSTRSGPHAAVAGPEALGNPASLFYPFLADYVHLRFSHSTVECIFGMHLGVAESEAAHFKTFRGGKVEDKIVECIVESSRRGGSSGETSFKIYFGVTDDGCVQGVASGSTNRLQQKLRQHHSAEMGNGVLRIPPRSLMELTLSQSSWLWPPLSDLLISIETTKVVVQHNSLTNPSQTSSHRHSCALVDTASKMPLVASGEATFATKQLGPSVVFSHLPYVSWHQPLEMITVSISLRSPSHGWPLRQSLPGYTEPGWFEDPLIVWFRFQGASLCKQICDVVEHSVFTLPEEACRTQEMNPFTRLVVHVTSYEVQAASRLLAALKRGGTVQPWAHKITLLVTGSDIRVDSEIVGLVKSINEDFSERVHTFVVPQALEELLSGESNFTSSCNDATNSGVARTRSVPYSCSTYENMICAGQRRDCPSQPTIGGASTLELIAAASGDAFPRLSWYGNLRSAITATLQERKTSLLIIVSGPCCSGKSWGCASVAVDMLRDWTSTALFLPSLGDLDPACDLSVDGKDTKWILAFSTAPLSEEEAAKISTYEKKGFFFVIFFEQLTCAPTAPQSPFYRSTSTTVFWSVTLTPSDIDTLHAWYCEHYGDLQPSWDALRNWILSHTSGQLKEIAQSALWFTATAALGKLATLDTIAHEIVASRFAMSQLGFLQQVAFCSAYGFTYVLTKKDFAKRFVGFASIHARGDDFEVLILPHIAGRILTRMETNGPVSLRQIDLWSLVPKLTDGYCFPDVGLARRHLLVADHFRGAFALPVSPLLAINPDRRASFENLKRVAEECRGIEADSSLGDSAQVRKSGLDSEVYEFAALRFALHVAAILWEEGFHREARHWAEKHREFDHDRSSGAQETATCLRFKGMASAIVRAVSIVTSDLSVEETRDDFFRRAMEVTAFIPIERFSGHTLDEENDVRTTWRKWQDWVGIVQSQVIHGKETFTPAPIQTRQIDVTRFKEVILGRL